MGSDEVIFLDTHVLVWADTDDRKLGRKARTLLERAWAKGQVGVSAISFWEIGMLEARRRLKLPLPLHEWRETLLQAGVIEFPLNGSIALRALDFVGLHDDPADRFIVATALIESATLLTADEKLLGWSHSMVRHDARI